MLNPGLTSQKVFFVVKKYNSKQPKNKKKKSNKAKKKIFIKNIKIFKNKKKKIKKNL